MNSCAWPGCATALGSGEFTCLPSRMEWCAITTRPWVLRGLPAARPVWNSCSTCPHTPPGRLESALSKEPMTQSEVITRLQPIFNDLFLEEVKLTPELTANDVEEWDSLRQISISLAVEKQFGIRFRVGEVEATKNVGEF